VNICKKNNNLHKGYVYEHSNPKLAYPVYGHIPVLVQTVIIMYAEYILLGSACKHSHRCVCVRARAPHVETLDAGQPVLLGRDRVSVGCIVQTVSSLHERQVAMHGSSDRGSFKSQLLQM